MFEDIKKLNVEKPFTFNSKEWTKATAISHAIRNIYALLTITWTNHKSSLHRTTIFDFRSDTTNNRIHILIEKVNFKIL